ncbi:hypothetical protein SI65_03770 [Aspergillus cristatus]|uniref:NCT transcriptional regulatory complex subunit A n=1 Tax=Aspergillus cristatus TaxID=573508 RepID=A0A1E3BIH5_ASPCR|nr:hypothetical protein SI65_03770 [Aspergillus cristatus]
MTDQDNSYRPRSPDFSSFQSNFPPPAATSPTYQFTPLAHHASYDASPFFTPQYHQQPAATQQYVPPFSPSYRAQDFDMARRSSRIARATEADPAPESKYLEEPSEPEAPEEVAEYEPEPKPEPEEPELPIKEEVKSRPGEGIEVRTKFPVARIKRIMQADEDVGKVAQVTPIAVSKALELFMISLVTKAAKEAKDRNSKRVTASHLKHAVAKDEVLDFLADIIAKVPDQPSRKQDDDGSDQNEGKRKRGGRRPKEDNSD